MHIFLARPEDFALLKLEPAKLGARTLLRAPGLKNATTNGFSQKGRPRGWHLHGIAA